MMLPNDMASKIINALSGVSEPGGVSKLWSEVCSYVKSNAQVIYGWQGYTTSVPPVPDPYNFTGINASIDTSLGNTLVLSGLSEATSASAAMSILSGAMNQAAALWMIKFPPTFAVSPCFVIPSIVLTPSQLSDQSGAMNVLCTQIIGGIKLATPAMAGSDAAYVGAGWFISIL